MSAKCSNFNNSIILWGGPDVLHKLYGKLLCQGIFVGFTHVFFLLRTKLTILYVDMEPRRREQTKCLHSCSRFNVGLLPMHWLTDTSLSETEPKWLVFGTSWCVRWAILQWNRLSVYVKVNVNKVKTNYGIVLILVSMCSFDVHLQQEKMLLTHKKYATFVIILFCNSLEWFARNKTQLKLWNWQNGSITLNYYCRRSVHKNLSS